MKVLFFNFVGFSLIALSACSQMNPKKGKISAFSLEKVFDLPVEVVESSGIIFYDSLLWTFNDGGHDPILYCLDIKMGEIRKEIYLSEAKNVDWEDITQDASSIYLGDIGNNWGNRKDLCVYKISKSGINLKKDKVIKVHKINYSYPDQINFSYHYDDSPYDCEAMVCSGDSLLLFTKNWKTHHSVIYSIPIYPGNYVAHRICEIDSKGLVTGAVYDPVTEKLAICGHKNHIPFVMISKVNNFLNPHKKDFELFEMKDLIGVRIEGIAFFNNSIYLSSEKSTAAPALYRLKITNP
jgi:hypothetical protein